MYMHHGWTQTILLVLILVFVIWPTSIFSANVSWWIVVVSAALLLIHALSCHKCHGLFYGGMKMGGMGGRSRRRRR